MAKKQFKTESKKLLDMMVNSIYTHKEIFLRELISNASDAIDKLYFRSLTDDSVKLERDELEIRISADAETRILTVSDNGCGMTAEELEKNLGTIARSGSYDFKNDPNNANEQVDIIGQFGVGFYSAFMVADKIRVKTLAHGSDTAYLWESSGADGYTVETCDKSSVGTEVTLYLKNDADGEDYGRFLKESEIRMLVKKYSDYIRYPVRMLTESEQLKEGSEDEYETVSEYETLNSMTPLWKKPSADVSQEKYEQFYRETFYDWEAPIKVIRQKTEGASSFESMLFIPSHAPYDYYSRDFEKGLRLYSGGVLIMEKCKDLIPDHFSFVRGIVDSSDLSLNISREMLQHDRQLKSIAKSVEKKIASELSKMLENERESYEKFYRAFGPQLKWGMYSDYGAHKDALKDLVMFRSSRGEGLVTLKEYSEAMKEDQKKIYFASGESAEKIALLPKVESVTNMGYEVLYLTDDVDEFALRVLRAYGEKEFANVCDEALDLATDEEKEGLKEANDSFADMLGFIKESIGEEISDVRFTGNLNSHAACLTSEGEISANMEKVLNKDPANTEGMIKATFVLEINVKHPIAEKLKALYSGDRDTLAKYSRILYANARLVSGLDIKDPAELSELVCSLML